MAEIEAVDELGAGHVAEDDRIAGASCRRHRIDVGIDGEVASIM